MNDPHSLAVLRIRSVDKMASTGTPDAEYVLFDPGEIELRSSSYGEVREVGYRTTGKRVRPRIAALGLTPTWVDDVKRALLGGHGMDFFRSATARRIVPSMAAWQLLDTREYRAETKQYVGTFLDTVTLASSLGLSTNVLQLAYLASIVHEAGDADDIFLDTRAAARERRLGERTHRRVSVKDVVALPSKLAALNRPETIMGIPKLELVNALEARLREDPLTSDSWAPFVASALVRDKPLKGPLADDELWQLELAIDQRNLNTAIDRIDAYEKSRGKTPGTAYLRARAALELGQEKPNAIAERLASLALSVNFPELVLLTALAWYRAGEPKRAIPFARDVIGTTHAEPALVRRAQEIIGRVDRGSAGGRRLTEALSAVRVNEAPPGSSRVSLPPSTRASKPPRDAERVSNPPPSQWPPRDARTGSRPPPLPASATAPGGLPMHIDIADSAPPPPIAHSAPPPPLSEGARGSSPTMPAPEVVGPGFAPLPDMSRGVDDNTSIRGVDAAPRLEDSRYSVLPARDRDGNVSELRRPSLRMDPRAEADSQPEPAIARPPETPRGLGSLEPPRLPSSSLIRAAVPLSSPPTATELANSYPRGGSRELELAKPTLIRDSTPDPREIVGDRDRGSTPPSESYMAGSQKPFFRLDTRENNGPLRRRPYDALLLEGLPMPPDSTVGMPKPSLDPLPRSAAEARALFTVLTRELGAEYRRRLGLELMTDVKSLETAQAHLREAYPSGQLDPAQLFDVHRHGAFVSELFARWFDAEWDDMQYDDVGMWSMFVPPRHRVWPFGRVLRFVRKGHRERDLVSYLLELDQLRADSRR